jgi:hypothetical protein
VHTARCSIACIGSDFRLHMVAALAIYTVLERITFVQLFAAMQYTSIIKMMNAQRGTVKAMHASGSL